MEKRRYRNTEDQISLLGFGCMRLPRKNPDGPEIDAETAGKMVDYAYRHGVNYFDTAYPYHEGLSETFIGAALKKYPRSSFHLADKMPGWLLKKDGDGKRIFEEQLQKCGVDYFDFYLCHSIKETADFQKRYEKLDTLEYLKQQRKAGRIRHLGFSFHGTPEELLKMLGHCDWDFVQIELNYLDWKVQRAKEQYRILEERGIPCIVMEPVRGGNLCTLCDESVRMLQKVHPDRSTASWAIRFAASLPDVLTVLSGMSTPEQVKDNIETVGHFEPMTEAERKVLFQARDAFLRTSAIPCTACRYCMDCPSGVNIPRVFWAYNQCAASLHLPASFDRGHLSRREADAFRKAFASIPKEERAEHCVACGKCMKRCPQGIRIPERMKEISSLISSRSSLPDGGKAKL